MKVTVVCLTYNHERYIEKCLDGFIMQKTDFSFQVLIGDDASTDATQRIIKEYAEKYPQIFVPVLRTQNIGPSANAFDLYRRITTPYVAICEGDDYWTDENKLQKQVNFLDKNPDFSICFHPVHIYSEEQQQIIGIFPTPKERFHKTELTLNDLLKKNFIQTNSVMYRWRFTPDSLKEAYPENIQPMDWFMHLLHAQTGKIAFLPDIMGDYRKHLNGIWFNAGQSDEWFITYGVKLLNFYCALEKQFSCFNDTTFNNLLFNILLSSLTTENTLLINDLEKRFPDQFKQDIRYLKHYTFLTRINNIFLSKNPFIKKRKEYKNLKKMHKKIIKCINGKYFIEKYGKK